MKNSEIENFLKLVKPFDSLNDQDLKNLANECRVMNLEMGERLNSFDELPVHCALVLSGELRLLAKVKSEIPCTLEIFDNGKLCGWSAGFRGVTGFTLSAKKTSETILIPISKLIDFLVYEPFEEYFSVTTNEEWYTILKNEINAPENLLVDLSKKFQETYFNKLIFIDKNQKLPQGKWYLTNLDQKILNKNLVFDKESIFDDSYPIKKRFVRQVDEIFKYKKKLENNISGKKIKISKNYKDKLPEDEKLENYREDLKAKEDLKDILGISNGNEEFPSFKGEGIVQEIEAIVRMLSRFYDMPFRKDNLNSLLKSQFINKKFLNNIELAAVLEFQGFDVISSKCNDQQIMRINTPAIVIIEKNSI